MSAGRVLAAMSGGVDSAVSDALLATLETRFGSKHQVQMFVPTARQREFNVIALLNKLATPFRPLG